MKPVRTAASDVSHASLCVLSFNRLGLIEPSLESLARNAGHPFELIVHDDGSGDAKLWDHLLTLVAKGAISTLILNPPGHNQGVGSAINRMFGMATGDPIVKLDQDLLYEPGWLKTLVTALDCSPKRPDGVVSVPLWRRHERAGFAWVDAQDEAVLGHRWTVNAQGYAVRRLADGRKVRMSRELLGLGPDNPVVCDHINGRRLDNRRANLRAVPRRGNQEAHRRPTVGATSKYRGVSWDSSRERWMAQAQRDGRMIYLGRFADELDAAYAAETWRREHFPFSQPDPALFPDPPAVGMMGLLRYAYDPVDYRKTLLHEHGEWEQHSHILGSGFAMPRAAWEELGPFESHSEAFAEDFNMMQRMNAAGLYCCALPPVDVARNVGFGFGPSTVNVEPGVTQGIHHGPKLQS